MVAVVGSSLMVMVLMAETGSPAVKVWLAAEEIVACNGLSDMAPITHPWAVATFQDMVTVDAPGSVLPPPIEFSLAVPVASFQRWV